MGDPFKDYRIWLSDHAYLQTSCACAMEAGMQFFTLYGNHD
jgi:hypothetical protein